MTLPARRPTIAVGLRNWPRTRGGRCSPRRKVFPKRSTKFPCPREASLPPMHTQRQSRRPTLASLPPAAAQGPPPPPPLPPPPPPQPTYRNGRSNSWASTWPVSGLLLSWQPNRSVTRRTAHIAREVYSAWRGRVGNATCAPSDKVLLLLGDLHLQPNTTQVHKMLHSCDPNGTTSRPSRSQSFLTFNDFCILVTELKRCYDKGSPQSQSCRRNNSTEKPCHGLHSNGLITSSANANSKEFRNNEGREHSQRRSSKAVPKYEVFLGGSCNPTTWRKDVAIPTLEKLSISYYNPQVSNWEPHLVELEYRAKQNATVLFFVIDKQTRNVAATVEAAYYSGLRRNLILVIKPYDGRGCKIGKDIISDKELEDLKHGQLLMQHLVERQGIPVFDSIPIALSCTSKVLRDNITVQDLAVSDLIQSSEESYDSLSDSILELRETFNVFDTRGTGKIPLSDVCLACGILRNRNVSLAEVQTVILNNSGILGKEVGNDSVENVDVGFDEFCSIMTELKTNLESEMCVSASTSGVENRRSVLDSIRSFPIVSSLLTGLGKFLEWGMSPARGLQASSRRSQIYGVRDVYLGGINSDSTWSEDIAIPVLKKNGLSYFCAPAYDSSKWRPPLVAMDNSRFLLFVISDRERALSTMTLASHYIGLGHKVVLCVLLLSEGAVVNGERLSEDAIKDYNRGRKYLIDLANKEKVPVFDNVKSALNCVVSKCLAQYRQKTLENGDKS